MTDDDLFASITDEDLDEITVADEEIQTEQSSDVLNTPEIIQFFMTMRLTEHLREDLSSEIVNTVTVDILNELTNGKVARQIKWKQAERDLYYCYFVLKTFEEVIQSNEDKDGQARQNNVLYAKAYSELIEFRIAQLETSYLELCEELGKDSQLEDLKEGNKIKTPSEYEVSSSTLLSLIYETEKSDS